MLEQNRARKELNFKLHVHTYCTVSTPHEEIYFSYEKMSNKKKKPEAGYSSFTTVCTYECP